MSVSIPASADYILKNSPSFRFRDSDEDTFAKMARSAIITARGADGRFLTRSPIDFFLSPGGKGSALMRPGSKIRDWGIKKDKFGEGRPVVVLEEDFPGVPIEVVADIFEGHARVLHRVESDKRKIGPALGRIMDFSPTPVSVVNEGVDNPESLQKIDAMLEMHSTYQHKVLKWLSKTLNKENRERVGFDINRGRVKGSILSSQITGYLLSGGVSVIEITCERNFRRPEVAIALDFQTSLNEKGYQTLLCSCNLRSMLLYVAAETVPIGSKTIRLPGSDSQYPVKASPPTTKNILAPLSLFIPPPPAKTSTKTKGMFSHDVLGLGYAIVPIHNDEFDPFYDPHPLVASYNIGKHTRIVSSFLRAAGIASQRSMPDLPNITEADDPELLEVYLKHRTRTPKVVESLPEEEPSITFAVPYGREVVVRASANKSTMAGFTDKSIRAGLPQLKQIENLMEGEEDIFIYGTLSSFSVADPQLPSQLLSFASDDWDEVVFHIEGIVGDKKPVKELAEIAFLLSDNVMPVRHAKGSILPIFEDEIRFGNAERLGFVENDKKSYFIKKYTIVATVLAMKASGKRFESSEVGPLLLGVMSKEVRPETWTDAAGDVVKRSRKWTTVYNPIGIVGTMKGFTVEDRRALFDHIVEHSTHEKDGYLFVDPDKTDIILEIEFSEMRLERATRYARETQMVKNTERFLTDAAKEVAQSYDRSTGRPTPVLPVAQEAPRGRRPDYVLSDYSRLAEIDSDIIPQVSNAKIVGIRSRVKGLQHKVPAKSALTAKTVYETDEGLVFSTDIGLDQFKRNGPEPHFTGDMVSKGVEAYQTLSINPKGEGIYSRHRQLSPWHFLRQPEQKAVDSEILLRTFDLDDPTDKRKAENFFGWQSRYNGYKGAKAIAGKIRQDTENWAIQSILIPKKYGLRRTANEVRLDSQEAPKWYQKAHPSWKKPTPDDILQTSQPVFRAWSESKGKPMALAANPPVFESPEAMDMGIQYGDKTGPNPEGKASSSKWHNQTLDGKGKPSSLSDIPWEALAWKTGGFLSEIGMHSKTHEDGTHTVGFLEKFADDPRPYIVSLKIDGDSSLAHFDGKKTVIWNKRGRWRRDFHITDQITTSLKKKGVKSAKIMGELYAVGDEGETLPLNEISSIIVSPKTIDRQKQIRFAGFDIVELDGENLSEAPYENRVSKVDGLLEGDGIMTVPFFHSKGGMKDVQKAWDEGMKEPNFEGLVLRFEGMAKSHKIKMKGTADLAVIGFYRGKSPGRLENSVGGAMLAWMLPNGDFVYAGKSVIGKSDKEKEKMVSELLEEKVEAPVFKIGGRSVDSSKTHINGRGTFTMVKPWKVSEHDYRSINWGKKPVFRFSKGKVEIVGEMNAPTMFQPSFKRWRDDKSINAHDLRIEQVPMEGTGKWGQVKA